MTNGNSPIVNYTQSGLIPHSQHIVRVTADSMATDTVPEELAHLRSLNITAMTLPDGEAVDAHHSSYNLILLQMWCRFVLISNLLYKFQVLAP